MLLQEGQVDAITGDDTVLAGLASQDPYAVVLDEAAFTEEPYGIGVPPDQVDMVRFVNGVLERMRADGSWDAATRSGSSPPSASPPASPSPSTDAPHDVPLRASSCARASARACAGELRNSGRNSRARNSAVVRARAGGAGEAGEAVEVMAMQTYLTELDSWVRYRKDELDELDAAALVLAAARTSSPTT